MTYSAASEREASLVDMMISEARSRSFLCSPIHHFKTYQYYRYVLCSDTSHFFFFTLHSAQCHYSHPGSPPQLKATLTCDRSCVATCHNINAPPQPTSTQLVQLNRTQHNQCNSHNYSTQFSQLMPSLVSHCSKKE